MDTFVFGVEDHTTEDGSESDLATEDDAAAAMENELLVERHLLRTQLTAAETKLRERNDELYFAGLKMKEKDEQIADLVNRLGEVEAKHLGCQTQLAELQRTCKAQYSQILELQYQNKRGSVSATAVAGGGVGKFQQQKEVAVGLVKKNKMLKILNSKLRRSLELLESTQMAQEDPTASTVGDMLQLVRQRDELARKEKATSWGAAAAAAVASGSSGRASSFHETRSEAGWDLQVHKTVLATPDDPYIDCKMKNSSFSTQLDELRATVLPLLRQYKDGCDKSVLIMWQLFSNKRSAYRPKDEFFKEAGQVLTKTKIFTAEVVRKLNSFLKNLMKDEKNVREKWVLESVDRIDMGLQADIEPPIDPKIAVLESEVAGLRSRLVKSRQTHAEAEQDLTIAKDKAELCLTTLQNRCFKLHQELYSALHKVYKHRFKWIARFPNPLRDFKAKTKNGVSNLAVMFNAHLGAIVDKDIEYLQKFGEYFTSDEVFGGDMGAACDERKPSSILLKEQLGSNNSTTNGHNTGGNSGGNSGIGNKDHTTTPHLSGQLGSKVPSALGERDGNEGRGLQGVKRRGSAPVVGGFEREKENVSWDMSRMESWRAKQSQIWERRRSSNLVMSRDAVTFIADRRAGNNPPPAPAPIEKQLDDLINWKRDVVGGGGGPNPNPPAASRQGSGTFNRIMLRRRNLPLRPGSEPNLTTVVSKGYLLEGSQVQPGSRPISAAE